MANLSQYILNKLDDKLIDIPKKLALTRDEAKVCLRMCATYVQPDVLEYVKTFNLDNTPIRNCMELFGLWCQMGLAYCGKWPKKMDEVPKWFAIVAEAFKDMVPVDEKMLYYAAYKEPSAMLVMINPRDKKDKNYAKVERMLKSKFAEFVSAPSQYIVELEEFVDVANVKVIEGKTVPDSMVSAFEFVSEIEHATNSDLAKFGVRLDMSLIDVAAKASMDNRIIREKNIDSDLSSKKVAHLFPSELSGSAGKLEHFFREFQDKFLDLYQSWTKEKFLYNYGTGLKQNCSGYLLARLFYDSTIINKDIIEPGYSVYQQNTTYLKGDITGERDFKPGYYDIKLGRQTVSGKSYGDYNTNRQLLDYIGCSCKGKCGCYNIVNYVVKEKKTCVCVFPLPGVRSELIKWIGRFSKLYEGGGSVSVIGVPQLHTPEVFLIITSVPLNEFRQLTNMFLKQYARYYISDVYVRMPAFYTNNYPSGIVDKQFTNYRRKTIKDKMIFKYKTYNNKFRQIDQKYFVKGKPPTLEKNNKEFTYENFRDALINNDLALLDINHPLFLLGVRIQKSPVNYIPWVLYDYLFEQFHLDLDYKKIMTMFLQNKYDCRNEGLFLKHLKLPIIYQTKDVRSINGTIFSTIENVDNKCDFENEKNFKPKRQLTDVDLFDGDDFGIV